VENIESKSMVNPRGILAVLVVLAVILGSVIFWLRGELRQRIVNRDLAGFHQIVKSTIREAEEKYLLEGAVFSLGDDILLNPDTSVPLHLVEALLGTLSLENVVSLVLFDREGFVQDSFPVNTGDELIPDSKLELLAKGNPSGLLDPSALELTLPIQIEDVQEDIFLGAVRYFLDPGPMFVELKEIDQQLLFTGLMILLLGGGVVAWILTLAFKRLEKANRLLKEREQRLVEANQKLLLAAKSAALGSLTANLVHGLKNPLAGLQEFVRGLKDSGGVRDGEDVALAMESARRMQDLIQDTLSVMQDADSGGAFHYTLEELLTVLRQKLEPLARNNNVSLNISEAPDLQMDSVRGNLLVLVLFNLGQNAIEASSSGQDVAVQCQSTGQSMEFRVRDQGSGLPKLMRDDPFRPVRSSKQKGSGIGLALSQQLARQMEGQLEVEVTSESGTIFCLSVPTP
jgi:signal transduction histidine kinase